jgi:hypothetical protein
MLSRRFAYQLIHEHVRDGSFEIGFFNGEECDEIAKQLIEYGCQIIRRGKRHLIVFTPEAPDEDRSYQ